MKTILAVTLAVSSILGVLLGVINHHPQQVYAQHTTNDNCLHGRKKELQLGLIGTEELESSTSQKEKKWLYFK